MAFLMTIPDVESAKSAKDKLKLQIESGGGIFLADIKEIVQIDNQRMTVTFKGAGKVDGERMQIMILAKKPVTTETYLLGLALCIPCLSLDFIDEEGSHPWETYALPAGYSSLLNTMVVGCQRMALNGNGWNLRDVKERHSNFRILRDVRCLYIGSNLFFVSLMLAMGSVSVDLKTKRQADAIKDLYTYDYRYIILEDSKTATERKTKEKQAIALKTSSPESQIVDVEWLKQCLILGRIVPPRLWSPVSI